MELEETIESSYLSIGEEYEKIGSMFDDYFDMFPYADYAPGQKHLIEADDATKRDNLLKALIKCTSSISTRISNLYNNFGHSIIDKKNADDITNMIVSRLNALNTSYNLYKNNVIDPYMKEVDDLFHSYLLLSHVLNDVLIYKNEHDQTVDKQLKLIYENGKLNLKEIIFSYSNISEVIRS